MYKQAHNGRYKGIWTRGNGYAWQAEDFLDVKHDMARRSAQWNMLHVGTTICGLSSWQYPCVLHRFWNKEQYLPYMDNR